MVKTPNILYILFMGNTVTVVISYASRCAVPRVEAGTNSSTVISASRKRRRKGNPVVSDETVMYGYESSATLTTDKLHYKLQTRPLVSEGAPRRRAKQFSGERKEKVKSGAQRGARVGTSHKVVLP
jgi:hypothetical protein